MRRVRLLALLVAIAVLGACSGGLSKAEYVKEADAVCARAEDEFSKLQQPQSIEELEAFVGKAESTMKGLLADLRELEPPEEISEQVDVMLTSLEEAVGRFPDLVDAAKKQDFDTIQNIDQDIQDEVDSANAAAQEIGLDRCDSTAPTG